MSESPTPLYTESNITHILSIPQCPPLSLRGLPKAYFPLIILTHNSSLVCLNRLYCSHVQAVSATLSLNCMYHSPFLLSSRETSLFLHSGLPLHFSVCVPGQGHPSQSPDILPLLFVCHESPGPRYSNPAISPVSGPYLRIISFGRPISTLLTQTPNDSLNVLSLLLLAILVPESRHRCQCPEPHSFLFCLSVQFPSPLSQHAEEAIPSPERRALRVSPLAFGACTASSRALTTPTAVSPA